MSPRTIAAHASAPRPTVRRTVRQGRPGDCRRYHICADARCWCHTAQRYLNGKEAA